MPVTGDIRSVKIICRHPVKNLPPSPHPRTKKIVNALAKRRFIRSNVSSSVGEHVVIVEARLSKGPVVDGELEVDAGLRSVWCLSSVEIVARGK